MECDPIDMLCGCLECIEHREVRTEQWVVGARKERDRLRRCLEQCEWELEMMRNDRDDWKREYLELRGVVRERR